MRVKTNISSPVVIVSGLFVATDDRATTQNPLREPIPDPTGSHWLGASETIYVRTTNPYPVMSSTSDDHDHDAEPVTDHLHKNSWSANLEKPEHGEDRELVVRQAIDAIEHTAEGYHVNLVTHENHGHPSEYLYAALEAEFGGESVEWEYIEQCGCGGHVVRAHV